MRNFKIEKNLKKILQQKKKNVREKTTLQSCKKIKIFREKILKKKITREKKKDKKRKESMERGRKQNIRSN